MDGDSSSQGTVINVPDPLSLILGSPPPGYATIPPSATAFDVAGAYAVNNLPWWVWLGAGAIGFFVLRDLMR